MRMTDQQECTDTLPMASARTVFASALLRAQSQDAGWHLAEDPSGSTDDEMLPPLLSCSFHFAI